MTGLVVAGDPRLEPASGARRASTAETTDADPTSIAWPAGPVTAPRQQPAGVA